MSRFHALLILIIFSLSSRAQDLPGIADFLPMKHHNIGDILYNPVAVNPALTIDSLRVQTGAMIQEQWLGFGNSPAEVNLSAQFTIPGTMHTAGLEYEWWGNALIRNQLMRFNYSYRHVINSFSYIKGGVSFDLSTLRLDESLNMSLAMPAPRYYFPDIDLGICYTRKRQTIGLAYNGLIDNRLEGSHRDYPLSGSGLLLNYSSWTRLGSFVKFSSSTILETDFSRFDYFIMTSFTMKETITGGVFYHSVDKAKGFFVHAAFLKNIEAGYQFHFNIKDDLFLGGHSFYLGYRLK